MWVASNSSWADDARSTEITGNEKKGGSNSPFYAIVEKCSITRKEW